MRKSPHAHRPQIRALFSAPPATITWPEGVWDKTVFSHGTMSVLVFTPRGRYGNISRAAEALGLERSHLYRKMKALGIHLREYRHQSITAEYSRTARGPV